jgi:hypothetical protein
VILGFASFTQTRAGKFELFWMPNSPWGVGRGVEVEVSVEVPVDVGVPVTVKVSVGVGEVVTVKVKVGVEVKVMVGVDVKVHVFPGYPQGTVVAVDVGGAETGCKGEVL